MDEHIKVQSQVDNTLRPAGASNSKEKVESMVIVKSLGLGKQ